VVQRSKEKNKKKMQWNKDPPVPPDKGFASEYYWFYDSKEKKMRAVEVWPGRWLKHFHGYWWITSIPKPPDKPPVEVLLDGERPEGIEGRSTRQTRTNSPRKIREVSGNVPATIVSNLDEDIPRVEIIKKRRGRPKKEQ
jgi:hypothetical protein